MITEDTSESEATARAADEDERECFFYTREAVNPHGANTLVQSPLQFDATPMRNVRTTVISGTTTDIGIGLAVVFRDTGIIQEGYIGTLSTRARMVDVTVDVT